MLELSRPGRATGESRSRAGLRLAAGLVRPGARGRDARALTRPPAGLFQPFGHTGPDRYPEAFDLLATVLGPTPRLLSFGCSSGEEVVSLARRFPGATLRGLDANPRCVRVARRRVRGLPATVDVAVDGRGEPPSSFDAVLAMAVFRHGGLGAAPPTCAPLLRFAAVEQTVGTLVDLLRPGGLLVLRHANVRLADTVHAPRFERVAPVTWPTASPVYGPDDRLRPGATGDDGVFRLLP